MKILDFIDNKIITTRGQEQTEWVKKYDIFTSRKLFKEYNKLDKLAEVEKIRNEIQIK